MMRYNLNLHFILTHFHQEMLFFHIVLLLFCDVSMFHANTFVLAVFYKTLNAEFLVCIFIQYTTITQML